MPCRCARTRRRTQSLPSPQPTHPSRSVTSPDHYLRTQPPTTSKPKTSKLTAVSEVIYLDIDGVPPVGRLSNHQSPPPNC